MTRIAVETSGDYKLYSEQIENPTRIYFDLVGLQAPAGAQHGMQVIQVNDHRLRQIRVAKVNPGKTRIVFDVECPVEIVSSQLVNPDRLMIEIRPKGTSLPALSASRSVTASQKVDLSQHLTEADSDVTDPAIKSKPSGQKVLQSLESPQAEPAKGQLAQPPGKPNTRRRSEWGVPTAPRPCACKRCRGQRAAAARDRTGNDGCGALAAVTDNCHNRR